MDLTQITRIVELMSKHDLTEIDIKSEELALTIKRERQKSHEVERLVTQMPAMPQMVAQPMPSSAAATPAAAAPAVVDDTAGLKAIESPLVGTYYAAPSPDSDPFVKVGDEVQADTVVCIIEAMKVMNEIKAEQRGIIRKVAVESSQPVEYGQPLFYIEPK